MLTLPIKKYLHFKFKFNQENPKKTHKKQTLKKSIGT